jgi:hypothetical protein
MATTLPTEPSNRPTSVIRLRAIVIGFLLCVPVVFATAEQRVSAIFSLMTAPISALLILVLFNWPLRRLFPKLAFNQTDLIVCFSIVSVAAAVGGEWSAEQHPGTYAMPFRAKWDAKYKDHFLKDIPDWLTIKDIEKTKDIESGGKDLLYSLKKTPLFLTAYLGWGLVIISLCFAMACINSLMRGAWNERERLTFPLIQLPVAMSEDGGGGGMWKSKHMWIAFAVMFSIDILNGLNYLYPNIPAIPVKDLFYIDRAFKEPPLSNIGDFRISIYPFMSAIGLFMPSDMLLSFVVFFLMRKATHVALAAGGIPQSTFSGTALVPGPPFFDEQTWGAVLGLFLGAFWVSKLYLREVWGDIKSGKRSDDGGIKHRWAFVGLLICGGILVGFGMMGGLPLFYMIPYIALFLMFSVVVTRVRAQLGPPTHEFAFFGPTSIMSRFVGTKWLSDSQATWLSQSFLSMNRIYRNHPMPYQLEAMKMGQLEKVNQKRVFLYIIGATVAGYFLSMVFYQASAYRTGRIGWDVAGTYLQNIMNDRKGPDIVGMTMTIFGFAVVLILDAIRFRFPGFPLHPAGYFLSMNYGVDYYWFGMLIALFVKNFVQRYYGLGGYDKLRAVALGILVGEYAAETIWMIMALVTKQSTYTISFNDRSLGTQ